MKQSKIEFRRLGRPRAIVFAIGIAGCSAAMTIPGLAEARSVRCGYSPGSWNAPRGALVVTLTEGIVAQVFAAGGHTLTHVMLSHGASWMAHAHRGNPMRNSDLDAIFGRPLATSAGTLPSGNPVSTLKAGQPGASTLTMGGTYASIYGDGGAGGPLLALYRVGDSRAAAVEAFVWSMPLRAIRERSGAATPGAYQLMDRYFSPLFGLWLERPMPYSFFQFKEIGTNHLGTMSSDGVACSTFLAWATQRATGSRLTPETVPESTVRRALQVAHDATRDSCHSGIQDEFFHTLANLGNACDKAGNQIANCMAGTNGGACDNYGAEYTRPELWGGGRTAQVISPDQLVNYDGSFDTASPWARTGLAGWGALSWSGEPRYGCWVSDDHFQE